MQVHTTLTVATLVAASVIAAAAETAKQIERGNGEGRGDHFVVFCARPSANRAEKPGHMFVVFGAHDRGKRASTLEAWGLYPRDPADPSVFLLGRVPGKFVEEYVRDGEPADAAAPPAASVLLVVRCDKAHFDKARRVARQERSDSNYQLLSRDCVTYGADVAAGLGLEVPSRAKEVLPEAFVTRLIDLNR